MVLRIIYSDNPNTLAQDFYMRSGSSLKLYNGHPRYPPSFTGVAFEGYSGLAEFSKRASGYLGAAAALVALLFAALDPAWSWTTNHLLQHFVTFERTVDTTLLIFLLLVSVFMAWLRVPIHSAAI